MTKVFRTSMISEEEHSMEFDDQVARSIEMWEKQGRPVPVHIAFQFLSDDEREFILTGIMPEEWDSVMAER